MPAPLQDDPRWRVADPLCTFLFAGLVLLTTFALIREIWDILMERVPRGKDIEAIHNKLLAVGCGQLCLCMRVLVLGNQPQWLPGVLFGYTGSYSAVLCGHAQA